MIGPIEKGVPVPTSHRRNGVTTTLREMEVGDSRLFAEEAQSNISARTCHMKPRKYVTRKEGTSIRVWRVA